MCPLTHSCLSVALLRHLSRGWACRRTPNRCSSPPQPPRATTSRSSRSSSRPRSALSRRSCRPSRVTSTSCKTQLFKSHRKHVSVHGRSLAVALLAGEAASCNVICVATCVCHFDLQLLILKHITSRLFQYSVCFSLMRPVHATHIERLLCQKSLWRIF